MSPHVVVVGAGPAGLSAADAALRADATVTLLDSAQRPGGQIHRMLPEEYAATNPERVQHGWRAFDTQRRRVLDHPACTWWPEASVWATESHDGRAPRLQVVCGEVDGDERGGQTLSPDALVLATGAHDRVLPFPGWDLPGVYTAGAAQALAKGERLVVGDRVVVAGTGPFLLPVAQALLAAGASVLAVLEANRPATVVRGWTKRGWQLPGQAAKVPELARYARGQIRHRTPYLMGRTVVEARGEGTVQEVVTARLRADWSPIAGTERTYAVDAVCVGHGFTAALELPVASDCALRADNTAVVVDADQRTSVPGVFAAGEVTGVGGAPAARAEGRVAGWVAGGGDPTIIDRVRRACDRGRAFAQRLADAHPIGSDWPTWLQPETVLCRCEGTEYAALCRSLGDPATAGARARRLGTRAGLGPCQARMCGPSIAELTARADAEPSTVHNRPIATPIRLGELAGLREESQETDT